MLEHMSKNISEHVLLQCTTSVKHASVKTGVAYETIRKTEMLLSTNKLE